LRVRPGDLRVLRALARRISTGCSRSPRPTRGVTRQGVSSRPRVYACLGACGKSAQIPLYVWLPDAMAGPTPVSALIHAATMVTAGVYMVARCNVFFRISHVWAVESANGHPTTGWLLTHDASFVVAVIGGATAFFAATMGLTQNDIKKVLAYSTVSQLGYMFL